MKASIVVLSLVLAACSSSKQQGGGTGSSVIGSCTVEGTYTQLAYANAGGNCGDVEASSQENFWFVVDAETGQVDMHSNAFDVGDTAKATSFDASTCTLKGGWTFSSPMECNGQTSDVSFTIVFDQNGFTGTRDQAACIGAAGMCTGSYTIKATRTSSSVP